MRAPAIALALVALVALVATLRIADCGLRIDCGFAPCSPQAAPLNPQSAIEPPQSNLRNPQSAIRNDERQRVLAAASEYLRRTPLTITASTSPRSAGGPHDFFSEGDYWWPDPADRDGPHIRRDGESNPDNFVEHRRALIRLSIEVPALTAAWTLTGDARYATQARKHLRACANRFGISRQGRYDALIVRDNGDDPAAVIVEKTTMTPTTITADMRASGGFIARLTP